MRWNELFTVAFRALERNKLRSGLTLLGVIIGVMTVVSVISIISGLNTYVATKLINLNPDVLVFTRFGIIRGRNEFLAAQKRKPITLRDAALVEDACRLCAAVGAQSDRRANVRAEGRGLAGVQVTGYTANIPSMLNIDLEAGRFFSSTEYDHSAPVAVIGADVKDEVFPTLDPLGRTIQVHGYPLRVIGLQARQGQILGQSRDSVIFVPLSFLQKILTSDDGISIVVRPLRGLAGILETQDEVRTLLRSQRRTPFQAGDPFGIVGAEAVQSLWRSISAGAFAVMILISGISLIVGAIVIANIMFVSVIERTQEIGLRRALGARRRDIRRQFLLEAAVLSAVGGVIGVAGGALLALAVDRYFPTQVRPSFVVLGIVVATVTGLLAGLAPSSAAAKLPPVEALRQE